MLQTHDLWYVTVKNNGVSRVAEEGCRSDSAAAAGANHGISGDSPTSARGAGIDAQPCSSGQKRGNFLCSSLCKSCLGWVGRRCHECSSFSQDLGRMRGEALIFLELFIYIF